MRARLPLLAVSVAVLACGDPTSVAVQDLAGTWTATSAVLTNPANTSQTVDLLAAGFSISFTIGADGSLTATFEAGGMMDVERGTITTSGNEVTVVLDNEPSTGTISRTGDTLTLDLITGVEWDFDGDDLDEPATLRLVLQRTG